MTDTLTTWDEIMNKLTILADSAKYDVACTSSGVERKGDGKHTGSAAGCGICHSFAGDGRCISLLKILMTNECIYNCQYCINRVTNDLPRATFTPEEICRLTMEFYRRNYIEGLFLSSGIIGSPNRTMGLLYETLFLLRTKYHFHGYIHVKGIPGASADLVEMTGYLADRMSVNLELPTAEGLRSLAPNKVRTNILTPMRQIQTGIKESRQNHGVSSMKARIAVDEKSYYEQMAEMRDSYEKLCDYQSARGVLKGEKAAKTAEDAWRLMDNKPDMAEGLYLQGYGSRKNEFSEKFCTNKEQRDGIYLPKRLETGNMVRENTHTYGLTHANRYFVPAGQSTQMIIGATGETDYQIMSVSEALYNRFEMKRVFYSAFVNVNRDETLPALLEGPPLLREHRLYQADFLLRFYGFKADELLSEKRPNFNQQIDPKCDWAVRHLEQFPVEINQADYYTLLRVPGIGTKSAKRIIAARKHNKLDFPDIKKMGVVLKRALYFITCNGRMMYHTPIEEAYITRQLIYGEKPAQLLLPEGGATHYEQMSIFDFAM